MPAPTDAITTIRAELERESDADSSLLEAIPPVYEELHDLAAAYLRGERSDHTLQATALINEAYLRLANHGDGPWQDQAHFFRLAAKTMRHILIDHARRRAALKRGGGENHHPLTDTALLFDERTAEILEIDDALHRLAALSPQRARVVEMRYYGGCTIEQTAETLGMSTATVERHWRFARAWLKSQFFDD